MNWKLAEPNCKEHLLERIESSQNWNNVTWTAAEMNQKGHSSKWTFAEVEWAELKDELNGSKNGLNEKFVDMNWTEVDRN